MTVYVLRRLWQTAIVLAVTTVLVFAGLFLIGDPVEILVHPEATEIEKDQARVALGLDKPPMQQYLLFLRNAATGDIGKSFVYGEPAMKVILERMPATLELAVLAMIIAVSLGIPLGLYAGLRPDSLPARAIMAGSILGFSLPTFWVGLVLIMVFAVQLGWLPSTGRGPVESVLGMPLSVTSVEGLRHALLPAANLALFKLSLIIRLTRAQVRENILLDYIRFARAKGLGPARVLGVHLLKNIMIPLVTVIGLELGSVIAFAIVTESVFAWPGMGKLVIDSIFQLDRPVVVGYVLITVGMFIVINLVVDLLYTALDPRVRLGAIRAMSRSGDTRGSEAAPESGEAPGAPAAQTPWRRLVADFAASRLALFGLGLLLLVLLLAVLAPWVAPQDPYDLAALDLMDARLPPGTRASAGTMTYLLGTDGQGRDMLSAILYGLRVSLSVGVASGLIALTMGAGLGILAAYLGGRFEQVLMRIVDIQLGFPAILVALVLIATLGKGVDKIIVALVAVQWAYYARTARSAALVERGKDYMEAARGLGLPARRLVLRHLLPNALAPLIVVGTVQIAHAIALEATLSFLGLGLPTTEPSLGLLISNGYEYLLSGTYWISVYPGVALLVTILSFNLVGDQLRDALNPRLAR